MRLLDLLSLRGKCIWQQLGGLSVYLSISQLCLIIDGDLCAYPSETLQQSFVSLHHFETRSVKVRAPCVGPILLPQCLSHTHKHKSVRALRWLQPLGCEDSDILLTTSGWEICHHRCKLIPHTTSPTVHAVKQGRRLYDVNLQMTLWLTQCWQPQDVVHPLPSHVLALTLHQTTASHMSLTCWYQLQITYVNVLHRHVKRRRPPHAAKCLAITGASDIEKRIHGHLDQFLILFLKSRFGKRTFHDFHFLSRSDLKIFSFPIFLTESIFS